MEEQQTKIKKGWKVFWIVFDIVFFGLCFLFSLIFVDSKGTIAYYDGLHRTNRMFGLAFLIFPFVSLYIAFLIIRVIFWKQESKDKKKWLWKLIITGVFCNPFVIMSVPSRPPGYVSYTQGFCERMRKRLDVEPIRNWLMTLDESVFNDNEKVSKRFLPPELRNSIGIKSGPRIQFLRTEDGFNCMKIYTSGGRISSLCGVVIGPKEMPIPLTEEDTYDEEGYRKIGTFRMKLEDGVYVFYEFP